MDATKAAISSITILNGCQGTLDEAIINESAVDIAIVDEGHDGWVGLKLVPLILEIGFVDYGLG